MSKQKRPAKRELHKALTAVLGGVQPNIYAILLESSVAYLRRRTMEALEAEDDDLCLLLACLISFKRAKTSQSSITSGPSATGGPTE